MLGLLRQHGLAYGTGLGGITGGGLSGDVACGLGKLIGVGGGAVGTGVGGIAAVGTGRGDDGVFKGMSLGGGQDVTAYGTDLRGGTGGFLSGSVTQSWGEGVQIQGGAAVADVGDVSLTATGGVHDGGAVIMSQLVG
jgi:hypothetical protein